MPKTTYANQKRIRIKQVPKSGNHLYCMMNIAALEYAMKNLKPSGLRLWLYLNKNRDGFDLELSPSAIRNNCGLPLSSCRKAVEELIESGHIVSDGTSNGFIFYEMPPEASP